MATILKLRGVDELLGELRALAPELTDEAIGLQQSTLAETAAELRAAYPVVTGGLRASVTVRRESSNSAARVFSRIDVAAPYAHFFEFGTARTAPRATFVPITRRGRETFASRMIARVRARGLTVGGVV